MIVGLIVLVRLLREPGPARAEPSLRSPEQLLAERLARGEFHEAGYLRQLASTAARSHETGG